MAAASTTVSCVCASLSLPWPVVGRRSRWGVSWRSIWSFVARPLVLPRSSSGVLGPSVGLQFSLLSGNWKTSRSSSVFRGYGSGFLPPTAGRSFIGGTSACSGSLLWLTAVSLAFELAIAVFCGGGGFPHGYWWSPVFPSFGCGGRRRLMYPWYFVHRPVFRSILAYSRLSFVWVFGGLVQVFFCLSLSVPLGVRSGFALADFSSLWFCLVVGI